MIRIEIEDGNSDDADVSIRGVDFPDAPADDAAYAVWEERWSSICNGIHALLAELGAIPETGWSVRFWVE